MGMAASQARFLMLTARKSNVEYEGQQVNQERTALANESANLYNQLSSIKVPTPPATSDYYETVYTFKTSELDSSSASSTEYTLNNIYTTPEGTYANLSYTAYKWEAALTTAYAGDITKTTSSGAEKYSVSLANGVVAEATKYEYAPAEAKINFNLEEVLDPTTGNKSEQIRINGTTYTLDGNTITDGTKDGTYNVVQNADGSYSVTMSVLKSDDESVEPYYYYTIGGVEYKLTSNGDGTYSVTVPSADPAIEEGNAEVSKGKYVAPDGTANSAASYLDEGFTTDKGMYNQPILAYKLDNQMYFISAAEFERGSFNSSTYIQSVGYPQYVDYPCTYSTAASGRYKTLTVTDDYGRTHEFSLNVTTLQDEAAYSQAMLDYEYEQARYSQKIKEINAKTEAIQQEDRTLELRLKQLDTKQNAIKTEMDTVQKVIEDNVESTFKTFA